MRTASTIIKSGRVSVVANRNYRHFRPDKLFRIPNASQSTTIVTVSHWILLDFYTATTFPPIEIRQTSNLFISPYPLITEKNREHLRDGVMVYFYYFQLFLFYYTLICLSILHVIHWALFVDYNKQLGQSCGQRVNKLTNKKR